MLHHPDAIARHGADALRYFLLREVGFANDGDFSWERFDARYSADLADGLGNLASRSLTMIVKYRDGLIPATGADTPLDRAGDQAVAAYASAMNQIDLSGGAQAAWDLVSAANSYIVATAPWRLAKQQRESELDAALGALGRCMCRLAVLTSPFMPGKAQRLWELLGGPGELSRSAWTNAASPAVGGWHVSTPEGLFPRLVREPTEAEG